MSLHSLVLCSDQKTLRVLRRVLSDLEIGIEHCADADSAVRELTRRRFEAVLVDCDGLDSAAHVLRSVRSAPCNKRAIAVAIIDGQKDVRGGFELGAHFVLQKPITSERAKSSFRAARALMKVERRRNLRLAVELPVRLISGNHQHDSKTSDLGEGGMAIRLPRRARNAGSMRIRFNLPGTEHVVECAAQVSWEGTGAYAGVRFVGLSKEDRAQLRSWLASRSPEFEPPDPPILCRLTDISRGGCYLEVATPFPVRIRVVLATHVAGQRAQVEGTVTTMHPETGMGVEFARTTEEERRQLESFVQTLTGAKGKPLEIEVEAEGVDDVATYEANESRQNEAADPPLELFHRSSELACSGCTPSA
jgi:CheY-like chemotaxis protein